jgi:hypothetical protein
VPENAAGVRLTPRAHEGKGGAALQPTCERVAGAAQPFPIPKSQPIYHLGGHGPRTPPQTKQEGTQNTTRETCLQAPNQIPCTPTCSSKPSAAPMRSVTMPAFHSKVREEEVLVTNRGAPGRPCDHRCITKGLGNFSQ